MMPNRNRGEACLQEYNIHGGTRHTAMPRLETSDGAETDSGLQVYQHAVQVTPYHSSELTVAAY